MHGHREVVQHLLFAIAKRHVRQLHVAPRGLLPLPGDGPLGLSQERINALDACHGGLDRLDLHAKTFNRRKNARYIIDDRHRRTDRHAEQRQNRCIAGCRKQHHNGDDHGIQQQHDGGVDRIVKIGALHGGVAVGDAFVVAALHVGFRAQRADGADVVQRFGHLAGNSGHGAAVIQLRGQHPPLHMAGKCRKQRQHQQQNQRKTGVFYSNHCHDGENAARVRHHADNARGEQRFHGVHIARKPRRHLAGVLVHQRARGQLRQFVRHFGPQRVGHFLPKQHQQTFLGRGQHTLQRQAAKISKHGPKRQRQARRQAVNDARQQQRRQQRCHNRRCNA